MCCFQAKLFVASKISNMFLLPWLSHTNLHQSSTTCPVLSTTFTCPPQPALPLQHKPPPVLPRCSSSWRSPWPPAPSWTARVTPSSTWSSTSSCSTPCPSGASSSATPSSPGSRRSAGWRSQWPGTVYSVQCTLFSLQSTVYSIQYTVYSVQCTVYSTQCTVYSIQYTVQKVTPTD